MNIAVMVRLAFAFAVIHSTAKATSAQQEAQSKPSQIDRTENSGYQLGSTSAVESVSRSLSVQNLPSEIPDSLEAVSRAVTVQVFVTESNPDNASSRSLTVVPKSDYEYELARTEAISRSVTAQIIDSSAPAPNDATSRSMTVVAKSEYEYQLALTEVIGKAVTICNLVSNGDLDENGVVNAIDVAVFVNVLLDIDGDVAHVQMSDFTCDGLADGRDVQPFVNIIAGGP